MMKNSFTTLLLFYTCGIFYSPIGFGQSEVRGKVVNSKNQPIPGANIIVKGTVTGAIADINGNFSFKILSDSAFLNISYIGYISKTEKIHKGQNIEIRLHEKYYSHNTWPLKRGDKPLSRKKIKRGTAIAYASEIQSRKGTITVYAIDTLHLKTIETKSKPVVWELNNYKIFLPFDSLLMFLEFTGYIPEEVQSELDLFKMRSDTIFLSQEFTEKISGQLYDLTISMLKVGSVQIANKNNILIKSLIVSDVFWMGHKKRCRNCCWGGVEFKVSENEPPLLSINYVIC